ncbi:MAG TPA: lipoprotein [Gammaproteobacteria bacterium]
MGGKFIIVCFALILIAAFAAGCGNKGALYLPDAGDNGRNTPPQQDYSHY